MSPSLSADIPTWVPASAGLWLLASTCVGWRRGIVRQTASLLGLVIAVFAGFWLSPLIAPIVPALGLPSFLKPLLGGIVVGVTIATGVSLLSHIIFKKTEDQGLGLIRLFYGFAGAGLGLIYGLAILGLAAWGVRFFGSFAEGLNKGANEANTKAKKHVLTEPPPLVSTKRMLEASLAGNVLEKLDPLPPHLYPRVQKVGQILTNPTAAERLLADPSMEVFSKNAKILSLRSDPSLQEALRAGDVWAVLRNPKVQLAAADAQLLTTLRTVDLDKVLDRALAPPVSGGLPLNPTTEKTTAPRTGSGRAKP